MGVLRQAIVEAGGGLFDGRELVPLYSVLSGFSFAIMGSVYWGVCYLFAFLFFVLAFVMICSTRWAGLEFAIAWFAVLVIIGVHLKRLGE
jgi:hypothetical protein